jgi:hypothetical protein
VTDPSLPNLYAGPGGGAPNLRFQVVTDDAEVLVDELVGPDHPEHSAARHGEIARAALAAGHAVTLVVRDPDLHDAVVHLQRLERDWAGEVVDAPVEGPVLVTCLVCEGVFYDMAGFDHGFCLDCAEEIG